MLLKGTAAKLVADELRRIFKMLGPAFNLEKSI